MKLLQLSYLKSASTFLFIFLCLMGIIKLQLDQIKSKDAKLTKAEYLKLQETERVKLNLLKNAPNFGFDNIVADWIYLQSIQYFGDGEARGETGYSLMPGYFEAVVDRDPRFIDAIVKLSSATSIFAGEPEKDIALLDKSIEAVYPGMIGSYYQPYYLWVYRGIDNLLFFGDLKEAKKSYEMAVKWAETYDDERSKQVAARMKETVQFLATNPDTQVAQVGGWTLILSTTQDERIRERAIKEIINLGGEVSVSPDGQLNIRVPED